MIVIIAHITHIQNTSRHWEQKKVMKTLDNAQEETLQHKGVSTLGIVFLIVKWGKMTKLKLQS
jgi:hypothetical protein